MKQIQRWEHFHCTDIREDDEGEFVLYEDYLTQFTELKTEIARLRVYESQCNDLSQQYGQSLIAEGVPAVAADRDSLRIAVATLRTKLEAEVVRLKADARRWRALFETTAVLVGEMADCYGLAGDEATEEIERWVALAATEED